MGEGTAVDVRSRKVAALALVGATLSLVVAGCDDGYARFVARVTSVEGTTVCLNDEDRAPIDAPKCYVAASTDLTVLVVNACVKVAAPDSPDDYLTKSLKEVKSSTSCKP
jgi:hypothetical protein